MEDDNLDELERQAFGDVSNREGRIEPTGLRYGLGYGGNFNNGSGSPVGGVEATPVRPAEPNPFAPIIGLIDGLEQIGQLGTPATLDLVENALGTLIQNYNPRPATEPQNPPIEVEPEPIQPEAVVVPEPITPDELENRLDALQLRLNDMSDQEETRLFGTGLRGYFNRMEETPENITQLNRFLDDINGAQMVISRLETGGLLSEASRIRDALNSCVNGVIWGGGNPELDANTINIMAELLTPPPPVGEPDVPESPEVPPPMDPRAAWLNLMRTMITAYRNNPAIQQTITQTQFLQGLRAQINALGGQLLQQAGGQVQAGGQQAGGAGGGAGETGWIWGMIWTFILQSLAGIGINSFQAVVSTK